MSLGVFYDVILNKCKKLTVKSSPSIYCTFQDRSFTFIYMHTHSVRRSFTRPSTALAVIEAWIIYYLQ